MSPQNRRAVENASFELAKSSRIIDRGLHGQVLNALGREIVDGDLGEGSVLNIDELQARFGVSRSVVRESLRTLETMGMVTARPQVGTRVAAQANWDLLNQQVVLWRGQGRQYWQQMREVLELRSGVETAAAVLAAQRMQPAAVDQLRRHAADMARAADERQSKAFVEADVAFHALLYDGSQNVLLAQLANTVAAVLRTRLQDVAHMFSHRTSTSLDWHERLVEAIAAGDAGAAEECAQQIVLDTLHEFEEQQPDETL